MNVTEIIQKEEMDQERLQEWRLRYLQTILTESETYAQDQFFQFTLERFHPVSCRTPSCVAGHAILAFGDDEFLARDSTNLSFDDIQSYAADLLGLDDDAAHELFQEDPYQEVNELSLIHI